MAGATVTMTGNLVGAAIYIAFAVAWVVGAWLLGVTAGKRGYNPVLWGVFSLFVSPVVGMILLALITPSRGPRAGS